MKIIKIRAEINKIESKKQYKRSMNLRDNSLKRQTLNQAHQEKKEKGPK